MEEVWKDIEGYENKYQVSNKGNVRSLRYLNSNKIKVLKRVSFGMRSFKNFKARILLLNR